METVDAKISKSSQKGVICELTLLLERDPCEQERRERVVFRAAHPHTHFLGECPLGLGLGVRIMSVLTMEKNAVTLNVNK